MEPALELAIHIVTHLWPLRELFPDARHFDELPENWSNWLAARAAGDYSLLAYLRELTGLEPHERQRRGRLAALSLAWAPGVSDPLDGQAREQLAAATVSRFAGRLRALRDSEFLPADIFALREFSRGEGDSVFEALTREDLVERAANAMIAAPEIIPGVARILEHTPQMIGQIVRAGGPESLLGDRDALRRHCRDNSMAVPFSFVLSGELDEIRRSRRIRYGLLTEKLIQPPAPPPALPAKQAFDSCLFGLALSGGGIRSATFALGVLQGLADRNMLPLVDYLSTVSGGGYIGSWLLAWIKRRGSIHSVQDSLRGYGTALPCNGPAGTGLPETPSPRVARNSDPRAEHVRPIRMLRDYARYLAPQAGLFSADSWTILSTWLRNTSLTITVLLLFLASVLLLPRTAAYLLLAMPDWFRHLPRSGALPVLFAGMPLWAACFLTGLFSLRSFYYWRPPGGARPARGDSEPVIVSSVLLLIVAGAFLEVFAFWGFRAYETPQWAALQSFLVFAGGVAILSVFACKAPGARIERAIPAGIALIAILASAAIGGLIAWIMCETFFQNLARDTQRGTWMAVGPGVCLMLGVLSMVATLFIGFLGRSLPDEQREWWGRLGAWVAIVAAAWLIISTVCFFSPLWIAQAGLRIATVGIAWGAITAAGVRLAFGARSGTGGETGQNRFLSLVMNAAPAVFVIGLLAALSFALYYGMGRVLNQRWAAAFVSDPVAQQLCCTGAPFTWQRMIDNYWALMYPGSPFHFLGFLALLALSLALASRVDVNEFSMHYFYKNRLVRAYLGASRGRQNRWPNAFTGFDFEDDLRLSRFLVNDATHREDAWTDCKRGYVGPYPIINTALNVTRGGELGRQERKAESFIFTPLWSGFDFTRKQVSVPSVCLSEFAFRRTDRYAFGEHGPFLGTTAAISGAAFTSNAGFHTSPSLAFLLTIFNVRLGWWIGNPRKEKSWLRSSPRLGLMYLFHELTAQTNTSRGYVLLSDGGHFENMGLYELVRRRCRFIVVSDAEEDAKFKLEGIGGAIRKCRVDFGAVIDLNLEALEPLGDPAASRLHYSVGTIRYPESRGLCGIVIYIKSSVTGDEPVDVIEFRKRRPEFPHESTLNQFFDESHFESYRALGHHAAQGIFPFDAREVLKNNNFDICATLEDIFRQAGGLWEEKLKAIKSRKDQPDAGRTSSGGQERRS